MREPEPGARQQLPGELTAAAPANDGVVRADRRFRAMGTDCHVVVRSVERPSRSAVRGPAVEDLLDRAEARIRDLEVLWSRFIPTSDTSRLNETSGAPVEVAPETMDLLGRADAARTATLGWFDPFLGRELAELGYDRSFEHIDLRRNTPSEIVAAPVRPAIGEPLRSRSPLRLDTEHCTAALAGGVAFDPGGIGKGHAADLVSAELVDDGAVGALVNLGGDLRVRGRNDRGSWRIDVSNPFDQSLEPVLGIELGDAGLATSSPLQRRWRSADGRAAHHLLDPRNGAPAVIELAAITVVAPSAATAEVLTTAVALAGPIHGKALLSRHEARAWIVRLDGAVGPV